MQQLKFTTKNEPDVTPSGPMCRLDAMPKAAKGTGLAGTGAVSSAFMGFLV